MQAFVYKEQDFGLPEDFRLLTFYRQDNDSIHEET